MSELQPHIYTSNDNLPEGLLTGNFFHSRELFELSRQTPRHRPYMVTLETNEGIVIAQMLALVRYRASLLPPYFYMECRIMGEGAYRKSNGEEWLLYGHDEKPSEQENEERAAHFEIMLKAIQEKMGRHVLFIEVSNLSQKMFAYRSFRQNGFFPVKWMSIHNSLHSRRPEERISIKKQRRLNSSKNKGVSCESVKNDDDFLLFMKLLRHHNWLKPRHYIPDDHFFKGLQNSPNGKLFITRYQNIVIGCAAVVYSQKQAFLWYSAFRRKSFAYLYPADITIWNTIKDAEERPCEHIYFMDVGLPFRKNRYRDFILSFGGKPVSSFRWFRCSIDWLNRFCSWIYA